MRKLWTWLGVALLLALARPSFAQTPGFVPNGMNVPKLTPQPVNLNGFLPNVNPQKALLASPGSPRSFDFGRLMPSFSFANMIGLPRIGTAAQPTTTTQK